MPVFGYFDAYKFGLRAFGKNFLLIFSLFAVVGLVMAALLLIIHTWILPLEFTSIKEATASAGTFSFQYGFSLMPAQPIVLTPMKLLFLILVCVGFAVSGYFAKMFLVRIGLDTYDHGSSNAASLKKSLHFFGTFFLVTILIYLLTAFGFLLLIIPGFIFLVKYGWGDFIVMDSDLGPIEAIQRSGKITYGYKWRLFGFYVLSFFIGALASLLIIIGPLIWLFVFLFSRAYVYRKLVERHAKDQAQFTAVPPNM